MAEENIKDTIKEFVNFDIENDYYQKEQKEELVRQFKKIVYEDDKTVRQFLKSFFKSTKELAMEYSLISNEDEVEEFSNEDIDDNTEEVDEPENINTDETVPESLQYYRKIASNLLYE
jgi:hypothetical protein